MTPEQIALLLQIPLVGIFVFYVLKTRTEDREERATESEKNRIAVAEEAARWRLFIENQQVGFSSVIMSNTEAMRAIGANIVKLDNELEEHDRKVSAAIVRMMERTQIRDRQKND